MPLAKYRHLQLAWEAKNPNYRNEYYHSHKEKAKANVYRYRKVQTEFKRFRMILFDLNEGQLN